MRKNFIPTIDISPLLNDLNSTKSKQIIKKIEKACVKVGFFQIINHGISKKQIKNITNVGNKFFKSSEQNKKKLAPKKWNNKNKNVYRGYFPNEVNGKEGLDIGDTKVTRKYAQSIKNRYIEYLNLNKSIDKKSIKTLSQYFNNIYILSEILFKSIIKKTADKDNVYTQTFAFYIGAIIISSVFYFIIGDGQYNTSNHPASQFIFREWFVDLESSILFMVATGITATLAFLLLFSAYSVASPSVVSPFEYSILLWSSLIGWLYFKEIPSLTTVVGILIIVSSGVYIFMREKAKDQSIATEKPLR